MAFAASDQTAELEKSNENGDAQGEDCCDVSVAAETPEKFAELEEEYENRDVQCDHCYRNYVRILYLSLCALQLIHSHQS